MMLILLIITGMLSVTVCTSIPNIIMFVLETKMCLKQVFKYPKLTWKFQLNNSGFQLCVLASCLWTITLRKP